MSIKYTPTTEQVRDFWASDGKRQPAAKSYNEAESAAEFDRWLAAHDAEVAAKALKSVIDKVDLEAIADEWSDGGEDIGDEREALARILADIEPGDDWPTNGDLGGHWALGTRDDEFRAEFLERADAAIAAGFRRSSRVPVSRDELARWAVEFFGDDDEVWEDYVEVTDSLTDRFDIYPKADRKPTDSGEAER